MAFTGTFTVTQTSDITSLVITDTSSYVSEGQGTFAGRQVRLYKIDTTALVPAGVTTTYINFPFSAGATITISGVLLTDYSLSANVVWLSNNPQPGSVYTATEVVTFLNYINDFIYGKVQQLAASPSLLNDTQWQDSMQIMYNEKENAEQATLYDDQFAAQSAINRAFYLINNENMFF
jgi:hypothetical protein